MNSSRSGLRDRLIRARSALSDAEQADAATAVVAPLIEILSSQLPDVVAGYLPQSGELDPVPTLIAFAERGWSTVLPVCGRARSMTFSPWAPGEPLKRSPFGIEEPLTDAIDAGLVSALLVPGVGFDTDGARIGHGAGYYDRYFAVRSSVGHEPVRIGLAHDVQVVSLPDAEEWDVAMHHLVTPTRVIHM